MRHAAGDPLSVDDEAVERGPSIVSPVEWAQLLASLLRRRWALALAVFLLGLAAAATYYRLKAPSYRVQAKILAQAAPAIVSGGRGDDLASRTAWDIIHRRENLVSLVQRAGLVPTEAVELEHGWVGHLLDLLKPADTRQKEEPIDHLVRALDKRLVVTAEGGTIEIRLDWPDPQHAYQVVQGAVQSFLEARHVQEVTSIDDVIAQMEGRTATLKAELEAAIVAAPRRVPGAPRVPVQRAARAPSEELVRLRSLLDAKARAARDVEEFRSRRLTELESQLTQARATLSEAHPTVEGLRRDIEALSHESPQLRALREEERRLRAEYAARLSKEGASAGAAVTAEPAVVVNTGGREEDPRVRDLRLQFEQMVSRVTAARGELDAARAAFKYRYSVIWPPEIPTEANSPNPAMVFGVGLVLALLLAMLAAVLPDLLSGRVVERWQVERGLQLPVLGEIPSSPRSER